MANERETRQTGLTHWEPEFGLSPFSAMRRLTEDMDRLFGEFGFGRSLFSPRLPEVARAAWLPPVEVFQRDDKFIVRADLPGLKREDVQIEVTDNELCIQGERRREHEEKREGYYRSERGYGSFCRVVPLPEGVQADKAEAKFRNGVLEISMPAPRPEERHGRRLDIKEA